FYSTKLNGVNTPASNGKSPLFAMSYGFRGLDMRFCPVFEKNSLGGRECGCLWGKQAAHDEAVSSFWLEDAGTDNVN
ncbi:MAG: hypothetical protein ABI072_00600, partial [Edaphobacter sp.]